MPAPVSSTIPLPRLYPKSPPESSELGQWGPDDQVGTLNLVDQRQGSGAWRRSIGDAVALGLPLSADEGIQMGLVPGRVNPDRTDDMYQQSSRAGPFVDRLIGGLVTMAFQCATHWDGLAHVSYGAGPDGPVLYNGFSASTVTLRMGRQN